MTCRCLAKKRVVCYLFLVYVLSVLLDYWTEETEDTLVTSDTPDTRTVCPPPYTLSVGDVPGPGSVDTKTHSMNNITE